MSSRFYATINSSAVSICSKFPSTLDNNYLASYDIYDARKRDFPTTSTAQSINTQFVLLEGHLTDKSGTMVGHLNTFSASGGRNLNKNFSNIQMPGEGNV